MSSEKNVNTLWFFGFVVGLIFIPLLSVLLGAFAGWVVGWFFAETILTFFEQIGITGLEMWQIGMALGFISGYFRSTTVPTK